MNLLPFFVFVTPIPLSLVLHFHHNSPSIFSHLPPQCTQGTKGLLETASRSPLLTSSCPQAKPQAVPAVLETLPEIVPSPAPEPPKTAGGRQSTNTPHKHHSHHISKAKQTTHHTHNPTHKTSNSSPRPHHSHSSRRKDSKNRDPKFSSLR